MPNINIICALAEIVIILFQVILHGFITMYCVVNYVLHDGNRIWSRRKNWDQVTNNIFNEAKYIIEKPRLDNSQYKYHKHSYKIIV